LGGEGRLYKIKKLRDGFWKYTLSLSSFWETVVGRVKREKEKNVPSPKWITESLALLLICCV